MGVLGRETVGRVAACESSSMQWTTQPAAAVRTATGICANTPSKLSLTGNGCLVYGEAEPLLESELAVTFASPRLSMVARRTSSARPIALSASESQKRSALWCSAGATTATSA